MGIINICFLYSIKDINDHLNHLEINISCVLTLHTQQAYNQTIRHSYLAVFISCLPFG